MINRHNLNFVRRSSPSPRYLVAALVLGLFSFAALWAPRTLAIRQFQSPSASQTAAVSEKRRRPEFVPGDVLVRFKSGRAFEGTISLPAPNIDTTAGARSGISSSPAEIPARIERFEGSNVVDGLRLARVAASETLAAVAALKTRDDVDYAEPNYILHADDNNPNDPRFVSNELYGLTKIGAPKAWDITQGSKNIVVGVIDQGIDTNHEDLNANIWTNPAEIAGNGIDDDGNGFVDDVNGYNFFDNNATFFSGSASEFHATHVAGTIGAVGNNSVGVVGVNWQVSLMSLKFLGPTGGSTADAIRAYNYAKQMRDLWSSSGGTKGANIRVLNNSYGGGGYSQAAADAIDALGQSGILFVAAAGNDHANNDVSPHYPANYSLANVISVAATDSSDALSGFSDYGSHTVMMGAPGSSILSTTPNNTYSTFSGTSMASPHVAGAAALLCAANPNLSVNQLRALLSFNGDSIPALQGITLSGRRLNVFNSLQALSVPDTMPPGTVTNFQICPTCQSGRTVNLSWVDSGDDDTVGQASLYDISFIDSITGAVIPLTTLAPATSGTPESVTVTIPYRHTTGTIRLREFDNVGNEGTPTAINVNVDPMVGDPYVATTTSATALSTGGTGLGFNCDDCFKTTSLSLAGGFPFFGTNYSSVTISSNGNIYFVPPTPPTRSNGDADDVPSSTADLSQFKMIAGMWDDLDLRTSRRSDADVYVVTPDPSRIIFRWQGVQFGDGTNGDPINFEIELRSDGTIITRYGAGNTNLFPVVGISGGEPDAYVIDTLTSELSPKSLTNAPSAVFVPSADVPVTIQTNPVGRSYIVDNIAYSSTQIFTWAIGTSHSIDTTSPQSGAQGTRYVWTSWSDGGEMLHTVIAPTSPTTYSANFTTQYFLTMNAGTGGTVSPSSGYFDSGQSVSISALANSGFNFSNWTGSGSGSFSGLTNPANVTMNGPITETATFTVQVTVRTNLSGRTFSVDDTSYSTTQIFNWIIGSSHKIDTTSPQSGAQGTQYVWTSWSDGGEMLHTVVAPSSPTTYSANFTTQYFLTMNAGTGGTVSPPSGYFDSGQSVTISATPNSGYSFDNWSGTGTGSFTGTSNPIDVTITGPITETGNFIQKTFQFSAASYSVSESSPHVDITVTRSGDTSAAASVAYETIDAAGLTNCNVFNGIASPRCDYINTLGTVSFAVGESSKSFSVAIVDDSYAEGPETFTVSLSGASGATLGAQSTATVMILDNDTVTGSNNPIDNTDFFVRQQYIDFLGREPDPAAADWINQINNCPAGDTSCDRIHVSQLFFQSAEFQQRGYYVYKFYPVSFGRKPFYAEFIPDLASVSGFLSDAQLEAAKTQFAVDFTARPAFVSAYGSLNNTQYVDALLATAEVTLSNRQSLIDGLNNSTLTRAQVLRQIVESTEVSTKFFNQAYAVMEYFGYLRREPDGAYLDWIHSLDTGTQPRTMVIGFVNSTEYRLRFGP